MAEAELAESTCGRYQMISKVNTGWSFILTSDRLRPDKRKHGTRYDINNDSMYPGGSSAEYVTTFWLGF